MVFATYRFSGEPKPLLAGYERMLTLLPTQDLALHICTQDAAGIELFDSCPSQEAFEGFTNSTEFKNALRDAGLPAPAIRFVGDVKAVFVQGKRSV